MPIDEVRPYKGSKPIKIKTDDNSFQCVASKTMLKCECVDVNEKVFY